MTNKEYKAAEGISKSSLFLMDKSPLHFKYFMEHPQGDTAALLFGRASHKYILEREDFYNEFAVMPQINRRTKAGKAEAQAFMEAHAQKDIITKDDFDIIVEMAAQINANEVARALLTGVREQSYFWEDPMTGERCKCRPDCLTTYREKPYIVDYKTCDSCQDNHFERNCRKYGYDLQAGMYTEGLFCNTFERYGFAFVAQEKKPPYAVRIYFCTDEYINQGYDKFRELIGKYHECKQSGIWYGYEGKMNTSTELYADE